MIASLDGQRGQNCRGRPYGQVAVRGARSKPHVNDKLREGSAELTSKGVAEGEVRRASVGDPELNSQFGGVKAYGGLQE